MLVRSGRVVALVVTQALLQKDKETIEKCPSFWLQILKGKGKYTKAALLGQVQGSLSFRWLSLGDRLGQGRVESLEVREAVVG